jgi:hypothetical protein
MAVSQAIANLRSRCRRQEAVAQFGKLLYRRLAVGPLPEWTHGIHVHSWHSRHSTHSAFCIAWPVCRNQWLWRMAKEDATEKAAEGHVWSRLVIFGHVQPQNPSATCSFSSSSSILRTSQRHDIFHNFKNLPALQSLADRPRSSSPSKLAESGGGGSSLPALQSRVGPSIQPVALESRKRAPRRRVAFCRLLSCLGTQLCPKFSKMVVFGCLRLRLVVSGRSQKSPGSAHPESRIQNPDSSNPQIHHSSPRSSLQVVVFQIVHVFLVHSVVQFGSALPSRFPCGTYIA